MNRFPLKPLACALLLAAAASPVSAASFVYEGTLDEGDRPASGRYDLRLSLAAGPDHALPLSTLDFPATEVVDGRFRLAFDLPGLTIGEPWVGLAVRPVGEGGFTEIPGRRKAVAGITACWGTAGDAGTNADFNFVGTTDDEPMVLRTRSARALTIEPANVLSAAFPITANVVAGASANRVQAGVRGATIRGGGSLSGDVDPDYTGEGPIVANDHYATVGGGLENNAGITAGGVADQPFTTIGGGFGNDAFGDTSTIAGGRRNITTGTHSAIGGGFLNAAAGDQSVVVGGNTGAALGDLATVSGGQSNCAGADFSWAAGRLAQVRPPAGIDLPGFACDGAPTAGVDGDIGTFVWADSENAAFASSGSNQFLVRARGGAAYNTNVIPAGIELVLGNRGTTPDANVDLFLRASTDSRGIVLRTLPGAGADPAEFRISRYNGTTFDDRVFVRRNGIFEIAGQAEKPTGGPWADSSDARLKHHVAPLAGTLERLLSLQGVSFEYLAPDPAKRPAGTQVGFVAQDVQKVFADWVSTDSDGYLMVASRGFEALTVEALRELRAESAVIDGGQTDRVQALKAKNAALQDRIDRLERVLLARIGRNGGDHAR